jgi:hypothetical protein
MLKTEATTTELTFPVSENLLIRLYSDTRPHRQLITKLQKGLILFSGERELAGEGIGLGVPAVRYKDRTYFSGSSTLRTEQTRGHATAIKKFCLNLATERTFKNISLETKTTRTIKRNLDRLYMNRRHLRLLAIENLLEQVGIRRAFTQTKPVGSVTITYRINPPYIKIEAEFSLLQKTGLQRIILLNEQGSTHFRKYYDSNGTVLFDEDIGAWETVDASWACIHNVEDRFGFRLWKHKDATLHRGREFLQGSHDWVGLDYEANPENLHFDYDIELVRS